MKSQTMWGIQLRHIQAFLAVAKELNFTRAARLLSISQPALSRTIAQMEQLLGVRLVHRTHQEVALTSAGIRFLPHAQLIVAATRDAFNAACDKPLTLRLGFSWNSIFAEIPVIVREFEQQNENVLIDLIRHERPFDGLIAGNSDLELVRGDMKDDRIDSVVLFDEPRMVAFPVDHRLSGQETVSLYELADEPTFVVIGDDAFPFDPLIRGGTRGRPETIGVRNIDEWLMVIAAGRGIGVMEKSTVHLYNHPRIHLAELYGLPPIPLRIAWLRTTGKVYSESFIDIALKMTEAKRHHPSPGARSWERS